MPKNLSDEKSPLDPSPPGGEELKLREGHPSLKLDTRPNWLYGAGSLLADFVPIVPEHELIRRIGAGSYGEVWLARNAVGTYRAVKVVYRKTSDEMEKLWDQEWRRNLLEASIVRVKKRVNAKQYQMFNLYVMMQWPMNQVKKTLGVSAAQVYMAKMRISRLIKSEVRTLERKMI